MRVEFLGIFRGIQVKKFVCVFSCVLSRFLVLHSFRWFCNSSNVLFFSLFCFLPFRFLSLQSLRTDGVIHGRFQRDVIFFLGICLSADFTSASLNSFQIVSVFLVR